MATKTSAAVINGAFLEKLNNPAMKQAAQEDLNDFVRAEMREEGAFRKIMTMQKLDDTELNPQLGTDLPVKLCWKEPRSPGAMTIPFMGAPRQFFIRGSNFPVYFVEVVGPSHMKHMNELRVYPYDIRQVLTDHSIRDVQEEEDRRAFVDGFDAAMIGVNQVSPFTGVAQWKTIRGGWTRSNLAEALKAVPSGTTKSKPEKCVINAVTVYDFMKWGRDEMGGDMSQDLLKNGRSEGNWLSGEFMNVNWLVTIKYNLVPDGALYMFAPEEFMGYSYALTDLTMFIERRAEMIQFHPYETIGAGLGNVGGICRRDLG
jgi:hypothetical protein